MLPGIVRRTLVGRRDGSERRSTPGFDRSQGLPQGWWARARRGYALWGLGLWWGESRRSGERRRDAQDEPGQRPPYARPRARLRLRELAAHPRDVPHAHNLRCEREGLRTLGGEGGSQARERGQAVRLRHPARDKVRRRRADRRGGVQVRHRAHNGPEDQEPGDRVLHQHRRGEGLPEEAQGRHKGDKGALEVPAAVRPGEAGSGLPADHVRSFGLRGAPEGRREVRGGLRRACRGKRSLQAR